MSAGFQVVRIEFDHLAHLFEGVGVLFLFQIGVRQLIVRLGEFGIDLHSFLELNGGSVILLLLHVLHAAFEVLFLGDIGIPAAAGESDG